MVGESSKEEDFRIITRNFQISLLTNEVLLEHSHDNPIHFIYGCFLHCMAELNIVTKWPVKPNVFTVSVFKFC